MKIHKPMLVGAFSVLVTLVSVSVSAAEYSYTYTGQPFTNVNQPFTTSDALVFQFTTAAPLGDNLVNDPVAPLSWSLSLGPLSFSSTTPNSVLYSDNFSTDATGNITAYQFTTQTDVVVSGLLPTEYPPTPYSAEVFSSTISNGVGAYGVVDAVYIPSIHQDSYYAYNLGTPGTWIEATVTPIPAAIWFVSPALAGLLGWRRGVNA